MARIKNGGREGKQEENNSTHMRNFAVKKKVCISTFIEEFLSHQSFHIYLGDAFYYMLGKPEPYL